MKRIHPLLSFVFGFMLATVFGLVAVLPLAESAWRLNLDSDVHRPLEGVLEHVTQSADQGHCVKAAAQLRLLKQRFAEYRSGGATPSAWLHEVVGTTQPSE